MNTWMWLLFALSLTNNIITYFAMRKINREYTPEEEPTPQKRPILKAFAKPPKKKKPIVNDDDAVWRKENNIL